MKMPKKKSGAVVADKAWSLLRLALLWARKAAAFKTVKDKGRDQIPYWERQLSFDKSPDFHFKKDRRAGSINSLFPCIGAKEVELETGSDADKDGRVYGDDSTKESYLTEDDEEEEHDEHKGCEKKSQSEEEEIDHRAEKFIAKFYDQIKSQN